MRRRLWLSLGLVVVLVLGAALEWWLLRPLEPNPFLVGLVGLLMGGALALLVSLWWPRRH
ncbi:hypothetical protein [Lacticaseibacillus camelliae]|nr:hypothetical protein [Lacticaseibacillus camelliae]